MNTRNGKVIVVVTAATILTSLLVAYLLRETSPDLKGVVGNITKKIELLADMRVNLLKSQEMEKSAVMADTDEASGDFAKESLRIDDMVDGDRKKLQALLAQDHTDQEMKLFQEFEACWEELKKEDKEILDFAVQNTNLKAAALSFGKGKEVITRFEEALNRLIHSNPSNDSRCEAVQMASDALAAGLKIYAMQAPHIAAANDEQMDAIEAQMRREGEIVDNALDRLAGLTPGQEVATLEAAKQAYVEFSAVTGEVVRLSRENTNIKSFALSLGKKRKIATQCDEILTSLQEAVRNREFKATR
ncbi:MAG: MCP four helix bundle domain-containing protein [Syntrophobacteraceae bacterium]